MTPTFRFGPAGELTITAGPFTIASGYPGIDGLPIRPLAVDIAADGRSARWRLAGGGELHLTGNASDGGIELRATLVGFTSAPVRVALFSDATVSGAVRCFHLAHGIGGGTGWVDLPPEKPGEGHALGAFAASDGSALTLVTGDIRRFATKLQWRAAGGGTRLDWTVDTEGIPLPEGRLDLPVLRIALGTDAWSAVRAAVDEVAASAEVELRPRHQVWCSWYYGYHHFTRADLDEVIAGLLAMPDRGGITTIQIDAGYSSSVGDWLEPNALWPLGLEEAFAAIRRAGFEPGIWIGPYMVGCRSRTATAHPDWLLRHADGNLVTPMRCYGENRLWSYRDEEYHVLDTSHPEAFAYLRTVFATLVRWGITYIKTDFLYWGLHHSAEVRRAVPGRTSVEYMRDLLAMIRRELGPSRYWLGCIAPYAPTLGFVDGTRIAGDVGPVWAPGHGPINLLAESAGIQVVNGRWFHNDPDAVLVRDFHTSLNPVEVRSIALWQGMLAGFVCTSDPLHRCAPDRLALWRFLSAMGPAAPAVIPGFGGPARQVKVASRALPDGRTALLVLNPGETPVVDRLLLSEVAGCATATVRTWGPEGAGLGSTFDEVIVRLDAHAAALWLIGGSADQAAPGRLSG